MENFWDYSVWGGVNLIAVLLISLLAAHALKRRIRPLRRSLIPTSVLGGLMLLLFSFLYRQITGAELFDTAFFNGNGSDLLEMITYHALALGFIASAFKSPGGKLSGKRVSEIFNTGITTVSTYLLQGITGLLISLAAAALLPGFFRAAGILLPFGYGQGTGQALNYGGIYEADYGFAGGKSFGLTIAALGFLSASLGGVCWLAVLKRQGKISSSVSGEGTLRSEDVQHSDEIPMQDSIDKITVQIALTALAYLVAYLLMTLLSTLLPGMRSVIFGFNFLIGVLSAVLIRGLLNALKKRGAVRREYISGFLMTRISNFFFDVMVVAGIAAIRLRVLTNYWGVMLIMGAAGLAVTFLYNRLIAGILFPEYSREQFLMMYGMLTGTASTGIILLRELDPDFRTPASENMVYQNFPAIVFGFPIMLLAPLAPRRPGLTLVLLAGFFLVMNLILFRSLILKKAGKKRG
ncbi:MAG: hypothetical protein IJQ88_02215 [Clostridia bacterium]|nr:hypothetical protein [Clostridia bacterium]MBQ6720955.1 hypothetical protein [Clostridia bacterium]